MARFYSDENFPLPVVVELRNLGHDVLTIYEDGKANQRYPDKSLLLDATNYDRAILTINRKHFKRLHRELPKHGGIILCTYDPDFIGQAQRVDYAVKEHATLQGLLVFVNRSTL